LQANRSDSLCLGANENGPTFANQNEPTRIAVILVQQPTANFI